MKHFRENIWQEQEYNYEAGYGFIPNLRFYLHEEDKDAIRPFMLVVPGGGYCMVVPPEGEIVAKNFYDRGMNCAVLTYTTDITMSVPLLHQPLNDISRALRIIRKNADRFGADPKRIAVCGFSAGAHVCGSLGVHYSDVKDPDPELNSISNRPDVLVLSYPVITSGEYTHIYSMWALLGKDGPKEEYDYFSLENHVTENTPPAFIWQTVTDDLVPVENSALFAKACREKKVPFAYYAFPSGFHGLSICSGNWFRGEFGEPYTMEQVELAVKAVKEGRGVRVSEARVKELLEQFPDRKEGEELPPPPMGEIPHFDDVAKWPDLLMTFLSRVW